MDRKIYSYKDKQYKIVNLTVIVAGELKEHISMCVIYESLDNGTCYVRDYHEFFEKFEIVN